MLTPWSLSPNASCSPLSILCLGAHCDDIEIGCGGSLLRLIEEGTVERVHWIVLSSNPIREQEARRSAGEFLQGIANQTVQVKGFRDAYFPFMGADLKDYFEQLKQEVNPDLIFTHHRDDLHQDHRLVADLTWNTFRDHLILEYEIPKYDGGMGTPSFFVPIKEDLCERKAVTILSCFESQRANHWLTRDTLLALMRLRGIECNAPSGYAEAFYCRKLRV